MNSDKHISLLKEILREYTQVSIFTVARDKFRVSGHTPRPNLRNWHIPRNGMLWNGCIESLIEQLIHEDELVTTGDGAYMSKYGCMLWIDIDG
jgi:hypothetical protein